MIGRAVGSPRGADVISLAWASTSGLSNCEVGGCFMWFAAFDMIAVIEPELRFDGCLGSYAGPGSALSTKRSNCQAPKKAMQGRRNLESPM